MEEENKNRIQELTAQLTPRGCYEAVHWGTRLPEGRKFIEAYAEIRTLEGDKVVIQYAEGR